MAEKSITNQIITTLRQIMRDPQATAKLKYEAAVKLGEIMSLLRSEPAKRYVRQPNMDAKTPNMSDNLRRLVEASKVQ